MFELQDSYENLIRVELFDDHATAAIKFIKVNFFLFTTLIIELIYLMFIMLIH